MPQWYRIFGSSAVPPEPDALRQHLRGLGAEPTGPFSGDEQGWFKAELSLLAGAAPVELERYLAAEEGIRAELNAWAAWIETAGDSPTHRRLMQQLIGTQQLITLRRPDEGAHLALLDHFCAGAAQFLAQAASGIWYADGQGFFSADGALLIPEH